MKKSFLSPRLEKYLWITMWVVVGSASLFILGNFIIQGTLRLANRQQTTPTPQWDVLNLRQDLLNRLQVYHQQNGNYPGSGLEAFSSLGLSAEEWAAPRFGILWQIDEDTLLMTNAPGDEFQIYIQTLEGRELHLYDGWSILCPASQGICYYHSLGEGNEVLIDSIQVIQE